MSKYIWDKDPFEEYDHLFEPKEKVKEGTISLGIDSGIYIKIDNSYTPPKLPDMLVNSLYFMGVMSKDEAYRTTGQTYEVGDWVFKDQSGEYWLVNQ